MPIPETIRNAILNNELSTIARELWETLSGESLHETFQLAAEHGHIPILEFLLRSTPDAEQRAAMIHSGGDEALQFVAAANFLSVVLPHELSPTAPTKKISKLRELREELIKKFNNRAIGGARFDTADSPEQLANKVIATLLTGENLRTVSRHLSSLVNPTSRTLNNDLAPVIGQFLLPVEFLGLTEKEKKTALAVMSSFFQRPTSTVEPVGGAAAGGGGGHATSKPHHL